MSKHRTLVLGMSLISTLRPQVRSCCCIFLSFVVSLHFLLLLLPLLFDDNGSFTENAMKLSLTMRSKLQEMRIFRSLSRQTKTLCTHLSVIPMRPTHTPLSPTTHSTSRLSVTQTGEPRLDAVITGKRLLHLVILSSLWKLNPEGRILNSRRMW